MYKEVSIKILVIGSGKEKIRAGAITLDINQNVNPDICHDLNKIPYPLESESVDRIECFDVIEHMDNIVPVMEECHRILKKDGTFLITTPHFSSSNSYIDPTHKFHLSYFSFDYFTNSHEFAFYSNLKYQILKKNIYFNQVYPIGSVLRHFANRFPRFYERRLAWIFPAWYLEFELKKLN
jgi:SAM-dependent methyltransferase